MTVPEEWPSRLIGVDFSGAQHAGPATWVAWGEARGKDLAIEGCLSAAELPGGRRERGAAHAALVGWLAAAGPCAAGLDFPFSLPRAQLRAATWTEFLRAFPRRFPDADSYYRRTQASYGEARRLTDRERRTPFAPNNLRMYRQTYHGLRDVLLPLVAAHAVRVLPLQPPRAGVPWLLESCPASALMRLGLRRPYKGVRPSRRDARAALVASLEKRGGLRLAGRALRERVLEQAGGDALDSVLAAWIAWRTLAGWRGAGGAVPRAGGALERLEGRVYDGG